MSDQARAGRDEFLELIIIALIALELVVGVLTLRPLARVKGLPLPAVRVQGYGRAIFEPR